MQALATPRRLPAALLTAGLAAVATLAALSGWLALRGASVPASPERLVAVGARTLAVPSAAQVEPRGGRAPDRLDLVLAWPGFGPPLLSLRDAQGRPVAAPLKANVTLAIRPADESLHPAERAVHLQGLGGVLFSLRHGPNVRLRAADAHRAVPLRCGCAVDQVTPSRCATAAASIRLDTPSLRRMFDTWTLAVFSDTYNSAPICRFVRPAETRDSTSTSRAVKPKRLAVEPSTTTSDGASRLMRVRREIASAAATSPAAPSSAAIE